MASSYTSPLDRKKNEDMAIKHEVLDDGSSLEVDTGQSIVNENGAVNNRTFLNLNCDARVENMNAHFGRNTVVNDTIVVEHSTTYRGCNNQRNLCSVKGGSSKRITIASVSINDGEDEGNVIPAEDKNAVCSAVKREDETRPKEITMGYDFPDGNIISKAFWVRVFVLTVNFVQIDQKWTNQNVSYHRLQWLHARELALNLYIQSAIVWRNMSSKL